MVKLILSYYTSQNIVQKIRLKSFLQRSATLMLKSFLKNALSEDKKKLISLSDENPVYYIWHKETVGNENPDFAAILHLLGYLPEPEFENSFIYSETDEEFEFLKKVGKVCKESE